MSYAIVFICVGIGIISTSLVVYLTMHRLFLKLNGDSWLFAGIVLGTMFGFIAASLVLKTPSKIKNDASYEQILASESQEPKEIREYRKQLYFEVGSKILKKKEEIRNEVEARAKKTLAEYRKRQEEIALKAELAKQREKTLSLVNESIKPRVEYDKKYKTAVAEIILLDDVEMEVKIDGKVQKFREAGVYKF